MYNYILKTNLFLGYIVLQLFYSYIIIIIPIAFQIPRFNREKRLGYKFSIPHHISLNKEMYTN
jgi:hypothetical protein